VTLDFLAVATALVAPALMLVGLLAVVAMVIVGLAEAQ
jgi:hypothetical protein